uniref:Cupin-like domain-containing protein n=1 Tax=Candidatus Kentrum sp. UNK TaxID=2126344 RepID=A0A451AEE6_9GAMM|nr:MAG: Cupin-like domain-containing protein [Candidatus Kentron sp. UNK]VFK71068.1 MAG: Cupin-like domain-containing protein [Candidatus Kentron sp. UNK]
MPIANLPERSWSRAAALHLGIRGKYFAESWAGLKPFLLSSLNGYPESGDPPGPAIGGGTAFGIKSLWALAAFNRQHPLLAALYRRDMPLPEFDWRTRSPAEFQREFFERPHPVVLRGFTTDSEAVRDWTFRSLMERFGNEEVLLTTEKLDGDPGQLKAVESGKVYLHNSEILFRRYPELADALPLDRIESFSPLRPTYLQFFLGREGTGTPFHSAANWNWFFNIEGRKKWWFVDPRHGFLIYPFAAMGHAAAFTLCGFPGEYDRAFFPAFEYCPAFEITLDPGDVLFNPPWWWHAVRNVTDTTVGVASRWMLGGQAGTQLRSVEENYDIDRMRSWLYFAGIAGWPHLQGILKTPSPTISDTVTLREQRNRFTHLQRQFSTEPVFGMRHRY